ncbi:uncharacterized protein LOC129589508 isoform X2 [Paramacrobiotus metropolitanus]|uniref:uncharacterized protein LOC129589508 isoform X2 n=1 Tax=Paramacrobiotus metropolitanus TaxID=2943436 RepID=UPI0024457D81|nr:uncharacterized protein LOC129589508 isoform X2 [Paramacrobiotus metropolitanus]
MERCQRMLVTCFVALLRILASTAQNSAFNCYSCTSEYTSSTASLVFDANTCPSPNTEACSSGACLAAMWTDPKVQVNKVTRACADPNKWTYDAAQHKQLISDKKVPAGMTYCLTDADPKQKVSSSIQRICFCTTNTLCNKLNWADLLKSTNYTLSGMASTASVLLTSALVVLSFLFRD